MKRTRQIMTGLSALAVALSSCTDLNPDIGPDTTGSTPLTLSVKASDGTITRGIITGTSLNEGTEIGLTIYNIRNCSVIETATNTLVGGTVGGGKIHESVTAIGEEAFYSSKVETIDLHAGATQLHDLTLRTAYPKVIISRALTPPSLGDCSMQIAQYNGTIKVPESALQDYNDQWTINELGYLGWSTASWNITALADGE